MNNKILAALAVLPFVTFGVGMGAGSVLSSSRVSYMMETPEGLDDIIVKTERVQLGGVVIRKDSGGGKWIGHGYTRSSFPNFDECNYMINNFEIIDEGDMFSISFCVPNVDDGEDKSSYFPISINFNPEDLGG